MAQVATSLQTFTGELDRIVERSPADPRAIVAAARPHLVQLLADMSWLDPRMAEPRGPGSVQYLLHCHPEKAYTVTATVFPVGYRTSVHNHGAWGLIGVWRGDEQEERFKRLDDRSRPDYADLRAVGEVLNPPGSVTHLIPPDEDVHRITNLSPFPSCSIHVYGADLDGRPREQYDLETGAIRRFQTTTTYLD